MDSNQNPVKAYLDAVVAAAGGSRIISVILFGSAATGGYTPQASDVDLILVLENDVAVRPILARIKNLEPRRTGVDAWMDRIAGTDHSCFVCTRQQLLHAEVANILNISPVQSVFVDRTVLPSMLSSARTVRGEDLLTAIQTPAIRRIDIGIAWFGLVSQLVTSLAIYPLTTNATKFAMGALKRSIHNCYFVSQARPAPLAQEMEFFGARPVFTQLLALRQNYQPSLAFVFRALGAVSVLHARTWRNHG